MSSTIVLEVSGAYIKRGAPVAGAAGSHNACLLELRFGADWTGLVKKVYFYDALGQNPVTKLVTVDQKKNGEETYWMEIPSEAMAKPGEMTVTVRGVLLSEDGETAEKVLVAASTTLRVLPASIPDNEVEAETLTPTEVEQIQNEIQAIYDITEETRVNLATRTTMFYEKSGSNGLRSIDIPEQDRLSNLLGVPLWIQAAEDGRPGANYMNITLGAGTGTAVEAAMAFPGMDSGLTLTAPYVWTRKGELYCVFWTGTYFVLVNPQPAAGNEEVPGLLKLSGAIDSDREDTAASSAAVKKAYEKAAAVSHLPVQGENGNWWIWESGAYVDSGNCWRGTQGERGEDGQDLQVQDVFPTLDALRAALPDGDGFTYQLESDRTLYVWSERAGDWVSIGTLEGPQGETGAQGEKGEKGDKGDKGDQGESGPLSEDFSIEEIKNGILSVPRGGTGLAALTSGYPLFGAGSDAITPTAPATASLALGRGYGTCATAAATAAKVGTLSGFVRNTGAVVGIKFTYANTAAYPTLNVNGTGAAYIYDYSTSTYPASGAMLAGGTHFFQFNGTQWVLLNPAGAKIATGSYTGTGTYGSSNPNSLTFPFTPKIVFLGQATSLSFSEFFYGLTIASTRIASSTGGGLYLTWSGSSVSWYTPNPGASYQFNTSGYVYTWIAIG